MKIEFVIKDLEREMAGYTTTGLALEALRRGHEVRYVPVGAFSRGADDRLAAHVSLAPVGATEGPEAFLEAVRVARPERMALDDLDVLMLRNDPADDHPARPWARLAGVNFARFAVEAGVLVLNDPEGLLRNLNKLNLEHYPPEVRPDSLISRDSDEIRRFIDDQEGPSVIKPLAGSGGRNVFLVRAEDRLNVKQMIGAVLSEGYVLAQEAVPEAAEGDIRLFLMNGKILELDGRPALMRRRPSRGDLRSNLRQGGVGEVCELSEGIRRLVQLVNPRIVADGLFLVGLDIVGTKLLEINVFSPGGLGVVKRLTGVDYAPVVIADIERKVNLRPAGPLWSNVFLNTL